MYVSNVPVSLPISVPNITPDTNMNGMSWSNKIGLFFYVSGEVVSPFKLPPMYEEE